MIRGRALWQAFRKAAEAGQRLRASLEVQLAEATERCNRSSEALGVLTKEHGALEAKLAKERERNGKAKEVP